MNTNFLVFGLTRLGIKPESTISVADALSTRPLIGINKSKSNKTNKQKNHANLQFAHAYMKAFKPIQEVTYVLYAAAVHVYNRFILIKCR